MYKSCVMNLEYMKQYLLIFSELDMSCGARPNAKNYRLTFQLLLVLLSILTIARS
jgi:hypothetical protein